MAKSPKCEGSGTEPKKYRKLESGWPYGRSECRICGNFTFTTKAGLSVQHRATGLNAYERQRSAELEGI